MYNPQAPFYLDDVTDGGLRVLAQHCPQLRCVAVGSEGFLVSVRRFGGKEVDRRRPEGADAALPQLEVREPGLEEGSWRLVR